MLVDFMKGVAYKTTEEDHKMCLKLQKEIQVKTL